MLYFNCFVHIHVHTCMHVHVNVKLPYYLCVEADRAFDEHTSTVYFLHVHLVAVIQLYTMCMFTSIVITCNCFMLVFILCL